MIFLLLTASVRSRPPGPPAVPGIYYTKILNLKVPPTLYTLLSVNPSRVTNPVSSLSPQESFINIQSEKFINFFPQYLILFVQWKGCSFQSRHLSPSTISICCQGHLAYYAWKTSSISVKRQIIP